MLAHFLTYLPHLIGIGTVIVAGMIARSIKTPSDLERAQNLATIAKAAAALVVSMNPAGKWETILEQTITQILTVSGLPTASRMAISREAAQALTALGKNPGVASGG